MEEEEEEDDAAAATAAALAATTLATAKKDSRSRRSAAALLSMYWAANWCFGSIRICSMCVSRPGNDDKRFKLDVSSLRIGLRVQARKPGTRQQDRRYTRRSRQAYTWSSVCGPVPGSRTHGAIERYVQFNTYWRHVPFSVGKTAWHTEHAYILREEVSWAVSGWQAKCFRRLPSFT